MENVVSGVVILFILLFAVFTLSADWTQSQLDIAQSYREMQAHLQDRARTDIRIVQQALSANGVQITVENSGSQDFAEYAAWDVIVEYFDDTTPPDYRIHWLAYEAPGSGWNVQGLYINAAQALTERYSPGILNPNEQAVLDIVLPQPLGASATLQATIMTEYGIGDSTLIHRNAPPQLTVNAGISVAALSSADILDSALLAEDSDHPATQIVYTVTVPPAQGTLSLGDSFTQQDIDDGLLTYTHTGTGGDQFSFTVSDGTDTIGPFVFVITVN